MAGFYPDVPAPRMAYDRDGSVLFHTDGSSYSTQLSSTEAQRLNDEGGAVTQLDVVWVGVIFPELRDLRGFAFQHGSASPDNVQLQTSSNTTNGLDGTWVSQFNTNVSNYSTTTMRTDIKSLLVNGVKGVRCFKNKGGDKGLYTLHLYGTITTGENLDRLRIWHPTLDEPLDDNTSADGAYFDWGDVTRNTTQDRTFRIKNNSATLTSNSIVLSPQALTDTTPTVVSQMTLSDGGAFTGSLNIGNLSPGALSPVITLRRTIASNATLSLWTGRINVNPGSWT